MIIMGNHLEIWDLMIYHISCGGLPPAEDQGFVDTGIGQSTCGDYCCGLTKLRAMSTPSGSSGYVCQLDSLANLSVAGPGGCF